MILILLRDERPVDSEVCCALGFESCLPRLGSCLTRAIYLRLSVLSFFFLLLRTSFKVRQGSRTRKFQTLHDVDDTSQLSDASCLSSRACLRHLKWQRLVHSIGSLNNIHASSIIPSSVSRSSLLLHHRCKTSQQAATPTHTLPP